MRRTLWLLAALAALPLVLGGQSFAATLPSGFQESIVFSGLNHPTNLRFSPDGRVFVAEKGGAIKVFDTLSDTTPTTIADLGASVHDFWDRGLLGFALDPNFPTNPYIYVLYTYDAPIGGSPPTWGDACPTPPGTTTGFAVISIGSERAAGGPLRRGTFPHTRAVEPAAPRGGLRPSPSRALDAHAPFVMLCCRSNTAL